MYKTLRHSVLSPFVVINNPGLTSVEGWKKVDFCPRGLGKASSKVLITRLSEYGDAGMFAKQIIREQGAAGARGYAPYETVEMAGVEPASKHRTRELSTRLFFL